MTQKAQSARPDGTRALLRAGAAPLPHRAAAAPSQELIFVDELEVWVLRKRVNNVNLRVKAPDGRIEVSVPVNAGIEPVQRFVREKRDWIVRQQERIRETPLGRAANASPEEADQWKRVVQAFVPPLIKKWEAIMGVSAGKVAYRNMTSRWGSCQPATGRICINTRLALYPPECLEYVVVHELCHLKVAGHGKEFYALMDAHLPDWRLARAKLK